MGLGWGLGGVGVGVGGGGGGGGGASCSLPGMDSFLNRSGISHCTLMGCGTNDPFTLSRETSYRFEASGI